MDMEAAAAAVLAALAAALLTLVTLQLVTAAASTRLFKYRSLIAPILYFFSSVPRTRQVI